MSSEIFLYPREIRKNCNFNMWFYFPGPESFAMASLGYLWLFKEIDMLDYVDIERVYSDSKTTRIMREKVDLIGVSLSFDLDFLKLFEFLEHNHYEFKAKDRDESAPLIFAGGPVITSNPEPYSEIFDFLIIGDGEGVNITHQSSKHDCEGVKCHSEDGVNIATNCLHTTPGHSGDGVNQQVVQICNDLKGKPKVEILKELSKLEGVYVPSLNQGSVKKLTRKLSQSVYTPILSEKSFFPNTFILEVERGCANRCGFCLASYINLPIRFANYEQLIEQIDLGLRHTNKIALLGAQVTAHPRFKDICHYIETRINNGENIEMSVSSLRVDSFVPEVVNTLVKAGQKNLTLAIEAGSERLRKVINKNLTEEQIFTALKVAKGCGLKGIKFYGMLGLPTETQEDILEIVNLTKKIKSQYKGFDISFGFSTFVPKANTPFQWFGRESEKSLEQKSQFLKKELHKLGVQVNISSAKWDYYQAVLSRGDRRLTDYLIEVYKLGGKIGAFKKAAKNLKIDTDYFATENYPYEKELPWDFIEIHPGKEFLTNEAKKLTNL